MLIFLDMEFMWTFLAKRTSPNRWKKRDGTSNIVSQRDNCMAETLKSYDVDDFSNILHQYDSSILTNCTNRLSLLGLCLKKMADNSLLRVITYARKNLQIYIKTPQIRAIPQSLHIDVDIYVQSMFKKNTGPKLLLWWVAETDHEVICKVLHFMCKKLRILRKREQNLIQLPN